MDVNTSNTYQLPYRFTNVTLDFGALIEVDNLLRQVNPIFIVSSQSCNMNLVQDLHRGRYNHGSCHCLPWNLLENTILSKWIDVIR